ncbi:MAG: hypothetical protein KGL39_44445 [Patescibacteria group bacterium]|nr:hypothetical protein [Patescibacteria group bacterium]
MKTEIQILREKFNSGKPLRCGGRFMDADSERLELERRALKKSLGRGPSERAIMRDLAQRDAE